MTNRLNYPFPLPVLILALLLSCGGSGSQRPVPPVEPSVAIQVDIPEVDSIPLIVLGSFLNTDNDLTFEELRSGIENGRIAVTPDIQEELKDHLGLTNNPRLNSVDRFIQSRDSSYIVCGIDSVSPALLSVSIDSVDFFRDPSRYRLWIKSKNPSFSYGKEITTYVHTGVTAITRQTGNILDKTTTDEYLSKIIGFFQKPELVHVSNEVSLVDTCSYPSMKMQFATKREHFEIIEKLGADIIELTGNHNLDFGKGPYLKSLQWYKEKNMRYFGGGADIQEASKPLVMVMKDSSKMAWIGYNEFCPLGECAGKGPGARRYDKELASKTIDSLKRSVGVRYIVACVQFGETDSYSPTASQKKICQELVDVGADVVIGSQAHQAQEIALYKGKPVFYGLGNFLFDQIHRKGVRQAFFLQCYIYRGRIIQYHPVYTFMSEKRIPTPANPSQAAEIQQAILKAYNF